MLRRPDQLQSQGLGGTLDDTGTASIAFFCIHNCLEFLRTGNLDHLDETELTSLDADLATVTQAHINLSLKAAGAGAGITVFDDATEGYAAIRTAEADITRPRPPTGHGAKSGVRGCV